jgi:hypothetical protein
MDRASPYPTSASSGPPYLESNVMKVGLMGGANTERGSVLRLTGWLVCNRIRTPIPWPLAHRPWHLLSERTLMAAIKNRS